MSVLRLFAGSATSSLNNPALWLKDWALGRQTASGEHVSHESAMGLSAYAGILIGVSQDVGKVAEDLRERRARPRRGSDIAWDHPLQQVLLKPNFIHTSMQFRMVMQHYLMGYGNAYAEIERNQRDEVVALWPIHPSRMEPRYTSDGHGVEYAWSSSGGSTVLLDSRDVFHLKALGGGIKGYSILGFAREAIGLGLAAQKNAAAVFGEGLAKRLLVLVKEQMDFDARKGLRKRIKGDSENDPVGYRKIPILEGDMSIVEAGINPVDAQALESRQFTVEEVARIYRYALQKLQYSKRAQGWSTLDALATQHVGDALLPWYVTWEQEQWDKLLTDEEKPRLFFKFKLQGLLRGDYKTRTEGYGKQFAIGVLSPNDIRELEDMNPITLPDGTDDPAGDLYHVQAAYVPLGTTARVAAPGLPPPPPPDSDKDKDEDSDEDEAEARIAAASEAVAPVFLDVAARLVEREASRLASAAKRHATNQERFDAWAVKAYADLRDEGRGAFGSCCVAMHAASGVPDCAIVATYNPKPPTDVRAYLEGDTGQRAADLADDIRGQCAASLLEQCHGR